MRSGIVYNEAVSFLGYTQSSCDAESLFVNATVKADGQLYCAMPQYVGKDVNYFEFHQINASTPPSASVVPSSSSAIYTSDPTGHGSSVPQALSGQPINETAIIGAAIAGAVVLALISGCALFYCRKARRLERQLNTIKQNDFAAPNASVLPVWSFELANHRYIPELSTPRSLAAELANPRRVVELDTETSRGHSTGHDSA